MWEGRGGRGGGGGGGGSQRKHESLRVFFLPTACHGYLFRSEVNTTGWLVQLVQAIFATVLINQLLRT